jgi:hypothetical protein
MTAATTNQEPEATLENATASPAETSPPTGILQALVEILDELKTIRESLAAMKEALAVR